jgi:glycosyltransferase involved in cell wall biosynthesis
MIKTVFFFRKPIPGYHSIEELFHTLIDHMPSHVDPKVRVMTCFSNGFLRRLVNILVAPFWQGEVNHITGDIHYIAYLLPKSKTILTIHDLEIIRRNKGWRKYYLLLFWFRLPAKKVRYITVISEFTRQELLSYVKIDASKVKVIPNCLPGNITYVPKPFCHECPVILQVGTKHNKNIPNLVKALQGIPCKLMVLGRLEPDQEKLLAEHGITYENKYGLSFDEVIDLYHQIDLLVFVSTYEGFGLPILEAQAIGRPVVTSNVSSMPEVAGDTALLVDPFDVDSIRNGILKIISDASLREELVRKGLENVKKYRPERIAQQYAELYEIIKFKDSKI